MAPERDDPSGLTRRQAVAAVAGAATLAGLGALGAATGGSVNDQTTTDRKSAAKTMGASSTRMPVAFVPHGGGPWPFVDMGSPKSEIDELSSYLRALRDLPRQKPKALLVVSAHWEEAVPTVMTHERPPMFYDYYGFPAASYEVVWAAPGAPSLATRVEALLNGQGIATGRDTARGFDHGTFVPLKLTYPDAEIPTTQLSLKVGLDPREHLAIGRALAPLRDEGVFIIGSGMTYHNMRGFGDPRANELAERFDTWLRDSTTAPAAERDQALSEWTKAPAARQVHPREEHLLPLMVIAGAAGEDRASVPYNGAFFGKRLSAYHFG